MALATLPRIRLLHPPRTGGTSLVKALELEAPAYRGHELPDAHERLPGAGHVTYIVTIRNPWDRMVSLFHHASTRHIANPHQFRWWLLNPLEQERNYGGRFRALISRPCAHWLVEDCTLAPLEHRSAGTWRMGYQLGRDVPELHENRTKNRLPYPAYYDGPTRELIAQWYHEDLEAFGYTFEGGGSVQTSAEAS